MSFVSHWQRSYGKHQYFLNAIDVIKNDFRLYLLCNHSPEEYERLHGRSSFCCISKPWKSIKNTILKEEILVLIIDETPDQLEKAVCKIGLAALLGLKTGAEMVLQRRI
jgi:hypothetical protein